MCQLKNNFKLGFERHYLYIYVGSLLNSVYVYNVIVGGTKTVIFQKELLNFKRNCQTPKGIVKLQKDLLKLHKACSVFLDVTGFLRSELGPSVIKRTHQIKQMLLFDSDKQAIGKYFGHVLVKSETNAFENIFDNLVIF